ncbi:Major facilitator, sugar transporter-like, partial [Dillenia turbinata]
MPAVVIASAHGKELPGKLTGFVVMACLVAASGGLIFGYDIGISGGVTSMAPFLKKFFPTVYKKEEGEVTTNQYCKFNSQMLTMFTSSLYLAALVASFFASWVTRSLGRKLSMLFGGVIFFAGAAVNAIAKNVMMLIIGRMLLGVGIGFANQSVPLYVSEMAPYKYRGALNNLFQLSITIGVLAANVLNYFFAQIPGGWGWRLSLGGAMVPALIIMSGSCALTETPNSLIERGHEDKAREKLKKIRGIENVEEELADLIAASEASKKVKHPWLNLLRRKYRPHLVMAILIPAFQQLTGMNVIMFYAPVLFKTIGFGSSASLFSAVITGGFNCFATLISISLVDKKGRRKLFLAGGTVLLLAQIAISIFIGTKFGVNGNPGALPKWYAYTVVGLICCFVSAFAWSWGPLGWLVPSEIFPLEIRSAAMSVTVSVNMLFTFIVAQIFLPLMCALRFGMFLFFAVFVGLMTWFIHKYLPETKGVPIEEMALVWKNHKTWGRFMPVDEVAVPEKELDVAIKTGLQ